MPTPSSREDAAPPESLWQSVKRDFAGASGWKVLAVVGMFVWMAFQWGWGNDILLPSLAATAFDAVDDGETWTSGIAAVGAAAAVSFVFWWLTQLFDAVVMLSGMGLLPNITKRISRFLRKRGWVKPYAEMKWSTRAALAYAAGASLLCQVDLFATGVQGVRVRRRMILETTVLSAGLVATVVALVTTAAMVATRVPATESGAEVFIRYAKNPLTWIVILAVAYGAGALLSRGQAGESESDPDGLARQQ